ncbi:MAG: dephospho-CoA kinase [Gemmatimonadota bacterium]
MLVGLTGNIASGKSIVTRGLAARGAAVIDADVLARRVVEPGTPGLDAISARWGPRTLRPDGSLDRAFLRRIIFSDPAQRAELDAMLHPRIEELRSIEVARLRRSGTRIVICDIPLLFEKSLESQFDVVVLVDANEETRLQRLVSDRRLTEREAREMIDAQWSPDLKRYAADIVVDNDGSLEDLEQAIEQLWADLGERAQR